MKSIRLAPLGLLAIVFLFTGCNAVIVDEGYGGYGYYGPSYYGPSYYGGAYYGSTDVVYSDRRYKRRYDRHYDRRHRQHYRSGSDYRRYGSSKPRYDSRPRVDNRYVHGTPAAPKRSTSKRYTGGQVSRDVRVVHKPNVKIPTRSSTPQSRYNR